MENITLNENARAKFEAIKHLYESETANCGIICMTAAGFGI